MSEIQCTDVTWNFGRHKLSDSHGGDPEEWPSDLRVREWPSAAKMERGNA